jgi:hypothetical protein
MASEETIDFVSGISLGQANEYTALAVLERRTPAGYEDWEHPLSSFSVRHLERFPIGTPYTAMFDRIDSLFNATALPDNRLVADQTAVGDPVIRLLKRAQIPADLNRVIITNGLVADMDAGFWQVPKKDLVGTLQVLLQEQRLKIAAVLPEVPTLVDELMNFRMKPPSPSTDPLLAWREGPQDDLLFAIAVAAWWIERGLKKLWIR